MDEALRLGELLKLPNLEADTIKLINEKMRIFIGDAQPLTGAQKQEFENDLHDYLFGAAKKAGE
ncbi:hypothetical protein [Paenibacillus taiwanensis]|uniref:hypothetical protein n=1 Tax=Paenibacillus taiwanensis TaxID=401638 RepID=UPI0003F8C6FF|nr:hypothetical protein [Paenibacillus taiwanensis]